MDERLRAIAAVSTSLGPPLAEVDVAAFERRHGVSLPDGFRRFLLVVGNGGVGPPHYGLVRLGRGPNSSYEPEVRYWEELPDIRSPFPFTKPWCWECDAASVEGAGRQTRHGCMFIGEDGCGMDWRLIVTGPERGNVWQACDAGIFPTCPKLDFVAWYEEWLGGRRDWFAEPGVAPDPAAMSGTGTSKLTRPGC